MDLGEGQPQNLNLKMSDTEGLKCDKCEGSKFVAVSVLRRVSPLVSPSAQEAMVPINTYSCCNCGWVNQRFLPKELTAEEVNFVKEDVPAKGE
tara:strand:- start:203 stop:481 length:279 start_codon:yes stop_codon:yes gene_type:complete